jgi:hypothetical protein
MSLFILLHVLACIWYWAGDSPEGWVFTEGINDNTLASRYLFSFQWALARSQPTSMSKNMELQTMKEKMLAIMATLACIVAASIFLSTVTTSMAEQRRATVNRRERLSAAVEYAREHNISEQLHMRMRKFAEMQDRTAANQREALLMKMLPKDMMMDVRFEVYSPILSLNVFFRKLTEDFVRTLRDICYDNLAELSPFQGDVVFTKGDACVHMLFVMTGDFCYTFGRSTDAWSQLCFSSRSKIPDSATPVKPGHWLSEAALWTSWQHCGELCAKEEGSLLALRVEEFISTMKRHDEAMVDVAGYAKNFVEELNKNPALCTDFIKGVEKKKLGSQEFFHLKGKNSWQ